MSPATEVWPGDTPFSSHRVMALADGCSCNVTTITTTVHVGAHADAPLHFDETGADAASVSLDAYLGPARVARIPTRGALTREALETLDLAGVERLLVATRVARGPARFGEATAWLDAEAARWLGSRGLKLFGIDTFSVDAQDSKTLPTHRALLRAGVRNLENLDLSDVPEGDYELVALPLRLVGADASPVRAVLRAP